MPTITLLLREQRRTWKFWNPDSWSVCHLPEAMSVLWVLLVCQCAFLRGVSCAQQELHGQRDDPTDTHQTYEYRETPDSFHDDIPAQASVNGDIHDRRPEISHFSKGDGEVCSNYKNGQCEPEATPSSENGPSTHFGARERKIRGSGWFSDWELPFSGKDEISHGEETYDENNYLKKESSVKVLHQEGDFERFLRLGHVVIVFFYRDNKVSSEALHRFFIEYEISSDHLLQYGIYLAVADCNVYNTGSYCSAEKVNRFAYGFREGQEKIAFPLDTLFNNNAIVASALHLDLINSVPILQTAGERKELERRCKGRCDIIFSFQRTLGTYEHRMFLEIAHAYQDSYVFAITTYTAGTLGLSNSLLEALYGNPPPLELRSTEEVERFLALQTDIHQAFNLIQGAAVGIFPSIEDSAPFMEAAKFLRSSHLTGRFISKQAASNMCSSNSGCILVSKPKDLLQPQTVLETGLNNSSRITIFLQHSTDFVLAPLDFERLSSLWPTNGSEGSSSLANQYLILFFIPTGSSLPYSHGSEKHLRKSSDGNEKAAHKDGKSFSFEEEIWAVLGRLAAEFSEPGFVFSWIKGEEPLAEKLITTYQLTDSNFNLVAINWKHFGENKDTKKARENSAYVYTCPDLSPQAVRPWLISLKEGLLKPSVILGENDWEPRLPGFDFIKFMMEDEDRDAEDQLMMEMESDLSSNSQRGDDGETLLHIHKEL
ncbi:uncharacterized protein [Palaemon carinicauda]|uniref:uncharacterized protein n=1 Tax=Palaemon carinicauda TaxID=392227 RepID=UPI0035B67539